MDASPVPTLAADVVRQALNVLGALVVGAAVRGRRRRVTQS
jgi:hypothetical protein